MKQVDIITKTIPNRPRSNSYPTGATVAIGAGGGNSTIINNGGGIDLAEARRHFLSKTSADTASGIIAFLQGLRLGSDLVDKLSKENTEGELTDTSVMSALRVLKEIANNNDELKKIFLRKDQEDTTNFLINLMGGVIAPFIQSPGFVSGPMGAGFTLKQNADGKTYAEVDKLMVRMKAIFQTLSIMETELAGASILINSSGARATITRVERIDSVPLFYADGKAKYHAGGKRACVQPSDYGAVYRCYFLTDDGDVAIENRFRVGNLVRSQTFNVKEGTHEGVSNHYWWRLVTAVGDNWIDLSVSHCDEGSDIPQEGNVIVQLGDLSDTDYQSAIALSAYGDGAPSLTMYQGINSYSLADRDVFSIGYDRVKQECFLLNYGRAYIGNRDNTQYLDYRNGKMEVRAKLDVMPDSTGLSVFEDAMAFSEQVNSVMAQYLGYVDWDELEKATLKGQTIIKDGLINTDLIFARTINAQQAVIRNLVLENAKVSGNIYTPMTVINESNWKNYTGTSTIGSSKIAYVDWTKAGLNVQINYWPDLSAPGVSVTANILGYPVGKEFLGCEANVLFLTEGTGRTRVGLSFLQYNSGSKDWSQVVNGFLGIGFYKLRLIDTLGIWGNAQERYSWIIQSFHKITDIR